MVCVLLVSFSGCKNSSKVSSSKDEALPLNVEEQYVFDQYFYDGLRYKVTGNSQKAESAFKKCLILQADHAPTLYELGQLELQKQNVSGAISFLQKASDAEPQNKWYLHVLAKAYEYNQSFEMAAGVYEQLLEVEPDAIDYYFDYGNALVKIGKYKEAIEAYDRLEQKYGVVEDISLEKEKLYLKIDDADGAILELNKLIAISPANTRYRILLATIYKQEGNTELAEQTLLKLEEQSPEDAMVQMAMYEHYRDAENTEKAKFYLEKAFGNPKLDIDTKIEILLQMYANLDQHPGMKTQSLQLLNLLQATHPNEAKTFAIYGDFMSRFNELSLAQEKYTKAVSLDSSKFAVWSQLLIIEAELHQTDNLLKHSSEALRLFPSQPMVYYMKGIALMDKKMYDIAIEVLDLGRIMVVSNPPLEMEFYASLGESYYRTEDYQNAWLSFERALKIDENNALLLNNYAFYLSLQKQELEKAKTMIEKCVRLRPDQPSYLDTYGWVLYQMEEYEGAAIQLQRAVDNGGGNSAEIREHLGDALYRSNLKEDAKKQWEEAHALQPSTELQHKINQGLE